MTRHETPFVIDHDLIIVEAVVIGPRGMTTGKFVVDTGTSLTTMIPELADSIGYSARDAFRRTRVHPAIGEEEGYGLRVAAGFSDLAHIEKDPDLASLRELFEEVLIALPVHEHG